MALGTILMMIAGSLSQLLLSNYLSVEDFGTISALLNSFVLGLPVAVFGLNSFWLRLNGEFKNESIPVVLKSIKVIFITTSLVSGFIIIAWAQSLGSAMIPLVLFLSLSLIVGVFSEMTSTLFQMNGNYNAFIKTQKTPHLIRLLMLSVLFLGFDLWEEPFKVAVFSICAASVLTFFYNLHAVSEIKGSGFFNVTNKFDSAILRSKYSYLKILKETWLFALVGILYLAWSQGHVILAMALLGSKDAGVYAATLFVLNSICLVPSTIYSKYFLPKIHRWVYHDSDKLHLHYKKSNKILFILGLIAFSFIYFFSPYIVNIIFPSEYSDVVKYLQILAFTIPIRFMGYNSGSLLVTIQHTHTKAAILSVVVAFNIFFILLTYKEFELEAFAWSIVISEFFLVMAYIYTVNINFFNKKWVW